MAKVDPVHGALTRDGERVLRYLEKAGLMAIHGRDACQQDPRPCPIHNPLECHMNDWPMFWRVDRHMLERRCPHGIGHPDHSSMAYSISIGDDGVHGCDGCCSDNCHTIYSSVKETEHVAAEQPAPLKVRASKRGRLPAKHSEKMLTVGEVAYIFGVDPKTVNRWAKAGKLEGIRTIGGHWRFDKNVIEEHLRNH